MALCFFLNEKLVLKKKNDFNLPIKTFYTKWYLNSITNTLFVWVYKDHINWRLDEDPPYTDTIKTELDQSIGDYRANGIPKFFLEILPEENLLGTIANMEVAINLLK